MVGVSGRYRLDQRLGGGGMAEVFLGSTLGAEGFSRRVAIKRVLPGYSDNDAFARMFIEEARISSQLVHPNIVSVLDFDRDADRRLFLVMELVDGKDLDALVSTGLLPVPVVIFVVGEVLRGLGFAHDLPVGGDMRGVVHRDVSPHNVLLSWDGSVKLSDFGIAKARSASEATASAFIKGKPAYMSPEQASARRLDGRSDLFAVGIMLWEMLVGRRLFVGEDTRALLAAVLFGPIPRPRSLRGDVPKDLERVCMKLLERDLPARHATAEHALAELLACADAPKAGREALGAALAERFPHDVPVRQSQLRTRARTGAPRGMTVKTLPDGSPNAIPAAALQSLGAQRNAQTATIDGRPPPRRRARGWALAALGVLGSGAVAFAVVSTLRRTPQPAASPGDPRSAASRPAAAAKPPPADAAAVPRPEVAKKDATPPQPTHPANHGVLTVTASPALTVFVGRKKYGDTPLTLELPVGKHTVRLQNAETGHDEGIHVEIVENQTMKIDRTK